MNYMKQLIVLVMLSTQNANLSSQRRQLESTVAAMQADLDEAVS